MRKLNIAIIGLGNIGTYLFEYLNKNKKILTEKNNCLPVVKYVSARNRKKKRNIKIKKKQWLNNYLDATKLNDIDLIFELIGGAEGPAKKLVFNALRKKKHVVTANKALIAKYGDELAKIAENGSVKHNKFATQFARTNKSYDSFSIQAGSLAVTVLINRRTER